MRARYPANCGFASRSDRALSRKNAVIFLSADRKTR